MGSSNGPHKTHVYAHSIFYDATILPLRPTQTPVRWVPEFLSLGEGLSARNVYLTTHLNLTPRIRMSGANPPCVILALKGGTKNAFNFLIKRQIRVN